MPTKIKAADYDYQLLRGSHKFPDKRGACLNEVAIVAAGFPYRIVCTADDCPPCFSRVISTYVIGLNDQMNTKQRQKLKRFVLRLAGSADNIHIEQERANTALMLAVKLIMPTIYSNKHEINSYEFETQADAYSYIISHSPHSEECAQIHLNFRYLLKYHALDLCFRTVNSLPLCSQNLEKLTCFSREGLGWDIGIQILETMLAIGNKAPPIPDAEALVRLGKTFQKETVPA